MANGKWIDGEKLLKELNAIEDLFERAKAANDAFEELRELAIEIANNIRKPTIEELIFNDDDSIRMSQAELGRRLGLHPTGIRKAISGPAVFAQQRQVLAIQERRKAAQQQEP